MGKHSKKKSSAKRKGGNNKTQEIANDLLFVPSKEMITSFEALSVDTTGTAEDHGLVGDCPLCLQPLPPFWETKDDSDIFENSPVFAHDNCERNVCVVYPCCGKPCCSRCRDSIFDRVSISAVDKYKMVSRNPRLLGEDVNEDAAIRAVMNNLDTLADEKDMKLYCLCPCCRFPTFRSNGRYSDNLKELLLKNSESGFPWAQYFLARQYLNDEKEDGQPRRSQKGIELLHRSTIKGYTLATYRLAGCYHFGSHGVKKSEETCERLLDLALRQGHGFAGFNLSHAMMKKGDYIKSLEYAKLGSDLGCGHASFWAGVLYDGDEDEFAGIEGDQDLGSKYYRLAADLGIAGAQHMVALDYRDEFGFGEDKNEIEYFRMAADQGYAKSQFELGMILIFMGRNRGKFIVKYWTEGIQWLRRSRDGGCDDAAKELKRFESIVLEFCFNCWARVDGIGVKKFKTCAKCKTVAYCSRKCQLEDWEAGHKDGCFKNDG